MVKENAVRLVELETRVEILKAYYDSVQGGEYRSTLNAGTIALIFGWEYEKRSSTDNR